jgi:hypothetical protein
MKQGRTVTEIAKELERQADSKRDFLTPTNHMMMLAEAGGPALLDLDRHGAFPIRETAHGQLAEHVGIPKAYYDRTREEAPALFAANVNHWLSLDTRARLVRALDGEARAMLSDKYRRLDNFDLAEVALPAIVERGFSVVAAEVTERRFYLKAVSEKIAAEVKPGDVVQAGISISNSEIGQGTLRIEPLLYFLVCTNGMILPDARVKKYHVGRGHGEIDAAVEFFQAATLEMSDRAFWLKVRDVVRGSMTEPFFNAQVEKLRGATGDRIDADPVQVVELASRRFRLNEQEKRATLLHFLAGHNGQGELTRYGLAQEITRMSADVESFDRATELEQLGGSILEMPRQAL